MTRPRPLAVLTPLELDRTSFPEFRDRIVATESEAVVHTPRSYPGHPQIPLPRARPRLGTALDRVLVRRRSRRELSTALPAKKSLARVLLYAHGVNAERGMGPTPSAGSLNALELYLVSFGAGWLDPGRYHYDRGAHALTLIAPGAERGEWAERVPSSVQFTGGALFWIVAGDTARTEAKYGERAARFLLLEAGHLMQNLCLLSESVGSTTLPLGGFFEREIARAVPLPRSDAVLYVGAFG
ncbi:MAG: SagB/ThcOx family dehydrogenase [Polyangiaceae bacterium]|nr:SagB/ThcOx family dehydrogenase [Polyangiaceae bacterium]MCE7891798.1 SagB/ThcOx family dehydrogenase [Sorangiineae bacterium PRO1]MCL4749793.1 SagB/ThcOx family dehydrogenase [Myxococcales bacterium]